MNISKVTILGANGTMGRNVAAIFASFGNAKVYMVSRTIEKSQVAIEKAYLTVKAESIKSNMIAKSYDDLAECIENSDLIFEACAESWDIKESIHKKIAEVVSVLGQTIVVDKIICSGTSGLSISSLAEIYEEKYKKKFMGMHFFNPPYNMTLCELIPTRHTDRDVLDNVHCYLNTKLHRTTVIVKDEPAFLGNRIGFQFINELMQLAEIYKYNGGIDYIDAIFGAFTGRNMAPLVTANFVGLDVHKAIVDNLYENTNDYAHKTFTIPNYLLSMINAGNLGRKTGVGLYKTTVNDDGSKTHYVYDIRHNEYREVINYNFPFVNEVVSALKIGEYDQAIRAMLSNHSKEAELCCEMMLKYILYSLSTGKQIGYDVEAADDVMATGFGWCPPLALIEAFGGKEEFIILCRDRIDDNILRDIDFEQLIKNIKGSKYDYRRFLKAKK